MKRIHGLAVAGGLIVATLAGAHVVSGITAGTQSAFVPIVPCRLLDTRPTSQVGPIAAPLAADSTSTVTVWGSTGNCVGIPATATAVAMNVTALNGTLPSFLTLFPADAATRPEASNLNWQPNQAPTPNKVDVKLSSDGKVSLYNRQGTVDVIADVVGYYEPVSAGTPGPKGDQGEPGPPGPSLGTVTIVTAPISVADNVPANGSATATCPDGQIAIGGGVDGEPTSTAFQQSFNVRASRPVPEDATSNATGWFGEVRAANVTSGQTWTATVYALCVTP